MSGADYARATPLSANLGRPPTPAARRLRPQLWPTVAAALLVPLFLAAGHWQWTKAKTKSALQQQLDARAGEPALTISAALVDAQSLRYRKVVARGHYEPEHQILIDNRTHRQQAGYHVITPLRLEGSAVRLLVNRGWVAAPAERRQLPQVDAPTGVVDVQGTAVLPATRFFSLGADDATPRPEWPSVWQNLDMPRYASAVSFPIQPVVVELDAHSAAGGLVREWRRPDERIQTNRGYALQWWTFAATTVVLWLLLNFRRPA